jgi:hypothetical protein
VAALQLALALVALLVVPLGLRAANRAQHAPRLQPTYLPALEGPRVREPFESAPIADLARLNPGYVVIGDSMAGTRIEPRRLGELAGRPVAPLLEPGSGPAWWYLALKNWVVPSRIHPGCVFIFFRDTNLTNALFRLDDQFRWSLDMVAGDREDAVNAVIASRRRDALYRLRSAVDETYQASQARQWIEPAMTEWPARLVVPYRRRRAAFMQKLNERFGLGHLRPMEAADMQEAEDRDADFDAYVGRSFLPLTIDEARRHDLTLCFVRVQRRPVGGHPPAQSPAMQRYIASLRRYIESHGAIFHDDTGDPALTLDMYKDGDHVAAASRRRYTEIFYERLARVFGGAASSAARPR